MEVDEKEGQPEIVQYVGDSTGAASSTAVTGVTGLK